jgi:hypothetical protein
VEAQVAAGLILLVFLGLIIAFFVNRGRRKIGLGFNHRLLTTVVVGVVLILLVAWVAHQ